MQQGHGDHQPPAHLREQLANALPRFRWYAPLEGASVSEDEFRFALTQRPMAMYHSWGRKMHGQVKFMLNPLFISSELADAHDLKDNDWAKVTFITAQSLCLLW